MAGPASSTARPMVSVVVPVLNEADRIGRCLESVWEQDYPADRVEVVVADGGSTDGTAAIVTELAKIHRNLRLVDNPGVNQAAGLNRAIAASAGEVVARLDGHAAWPPGHLRRCVELLKSTGADNVGGTMEPVVESPLAAAVARAMRSRFGAGGATYRYGLRAGDVETVFLGCFRRAAIERAGGFDEQAPPHEDYVMNARIRAMGGRVHFSPDLPTYYWPRDTWRGLALQYFRYGRGKARASRAQPAVLRPYHLLPASLVAGAVGVVALATVSGRARRVGAVCLVGYGLASVAAAQHAAGDQPLGVRSRLTAVFPLLHVSWGAGFWAGLLEAVLG